MDVSRSVNWLPTEVDRDSLSVATRNSVGSIMTVFKLSDPARQELEAAATGQSVTVADPDVDLEMVDPLGNVEAIAFERIKDQINQLDWEEMQELVAGILRAMNYKTQVSPPGSDLGTPGRAAPQKFPSWTKQPDACGGRSRYHSTRR